ncbi:MAG: hypothetical protein HKN13_10525 [Rhodothermales bacterium]|nr:hypothetical protein [Rhodothermales bacterium]
MLLFPKLIVRDGLCVFPPAAILDSLYEDPIEMARLLRVMNARSLLIVDANESKDARGLQMATAVAQKVDIPIQFEGGMLHADTVAAAIESGIYRCIVPVACSNDAKIACSLISEFGASRLTVRFPASLCLGDDGTVADLLSNLTESACSRVILTLDEGTSWQSSENFERKLAVIVGHKSPKRLRISVDGGITDSSDLLKLKETAPKAVDSVILSDSFFTSSFPCQAFWAWTDRDSIDLDNFSTATLKC